MYLSRSLSLSHRPFPSVARPPPTTYPHPTYIHLLTCAVLPLGSFHSCHMHMPVVMSGGSEDPPCTLIPPPRTRALRLHLRWDHVITVVERALLDFLSLSGPLSLSITLSISPLFDSIFFPLSLGARPLLPPFQNISPYPSFFLLPET